MALQTAAIKNALASAYASTITHAEVATTSPGGTAGTAAGSRAPITWGSPSGGVITGTAAIAVAAGVTVNGINLYNASTGGTYEDGGTVTSQNFATAGTYNLTITLTIS